MAGVSPLFSARLSGKVRMAGILLAFSAVVFWAGNYITARLIVGSLPPLTANFLRWLTALIIILPFCWKDVRHDWPLMRARWRVVVPASLLIVTCMNSCIFLASRTTTSINMTLVATSSPIFMLVFSRLFNKEAITPVRLLGMALAIFGIAWLITGGRFSLLQGIGTNQGDWWMVGCAFSFAGYSVLLQRFPEGRTLLGWMAVVYAIGLVPLIPLVAWEFSANPVLRFGVRELVALLYLGLCASILAFLCWQGAISRIGPARAGTIYYLLPLITALLAAPILGEVITRTHIISAVFILGGVIIASRR